MTAQKFPVEVMVDTKKDPARGMKMLLHKARNLRMSEDPNLAALGAKWEAAMHEALEAILGRNGAKKNE